MKRKILACLLVLMMACTLCACGGAAKSESMMVGGAAAGGTAMDSGAAMENGSLTMGDYVTEDAAPEAPMEEEKQEAGERPRKMVYTADIQMETTEFETAVQSLAELTERFDGYYENSTIGNRGNNYRWAEYTVRVPAAQYNAFLEQVGEISHVTWKNTTSKNISESYYDVAGRLETQKIKLDRLQELLSKAELMEDIITIESAISETEWMIEDLSGTLRHYDGMVDYATVYVHLNEVYKLSNMEEVPENFGSRMAASFTNGWRDFTDAMENFVVGLAYSWMWLVILGGAVVVVIVVIRKTSRKARMARAQKKAMEQQEEK